jgi:lipooligosaccharide transport system permease protein
MTTGTRLQTRVVPPLRLGPHRALHVIERNAREHRQAWRVLFSGFFEPLFYLFSIGVGLGALIGDVPGPGGTPISYEAFVAPALLASSAMNGAVLETTMNVFFKLKYARIYDAMLATPLEPRDIAVGEIGFSLLRGGLYAGSFLVVVSVMGLMTSPLGLLALPAALLIGFAFGAVGMAATTFMRTWQDFDLVTLVTMPLFLFSATFTPIGEYPGSVQTIVKVSPLYHGTELVRGLLLGVPDWSMLGHVAYLVALGVIGLRIANRRIESMLKR